MTNQASYSTYNLKGFQSSNRFPLRAPQSLRGKPRQSEPPVFTRSSFDADTTSKLIKNELGISPSLTLNKFVKGYDDTIMGKASGINLNSLHNFDSNKSGTSGQNFQHYAPNNHSQQSGGLQWGSMSLNAKVQSSNLSSKASNLRQSPSDTLGINRNPPGLNSEKTIRNESMFEPMSSSRFQSHSSHMLPHPPPPALNNYTKIPQFNNHHHNNVYSYGSHNNNNNSMDATKKIPRFSEPPNFLSNDDNESTHSSNHSKNIGVTLQNSPPLRNKPQSDSFGGTGSSSSTSTTGFNQMFKKHKDAVASSPANGPKNGRCDFKVSDFYKGKDLGSGKFGSVNVVRHRKTGFVCAMKTVPKSIIKEENIINQFVREVKIQSCLDHPNIIKLYGFFEDRQNIYLLLELGSEGQLYKKIKSKKRFTEATTAYVSRQICEAIKYLHSLHIIHRDLKPENIVVSYGTVKLCDFGWAVCKGSELRSTFCGTPLYVSPEILKGQLYDQKIDLWSVGIMTYEMLVGEIPFEISSEQELVKIIKQDIVFPSDISLSNQAKDFVLKILKKNPDERLKVERLLEHPFLNRSMDLSQISL